MLSPTLNSDWSQYEIEIEANFKMFWFSHFDNFDDVIKNDDKDFDG